MAIEIIADVFPGRVQSQVGCGLVQPCLVGGVTDHGSGDGTGWC